MTPGKFRRRERYWSRTLYWVGVVVFVGMPLSALAGKPALDQGSDELPDLPPRLNLLDDLDSGANADLEEATRPRPLLRLVPPLRESAGASTATVDRMRRAPSELKVDPDVGGGLWEFDDGMSDNVTTLVMDQVQADIEHILKEVDQNAAEAQKRIDYLESRLDLGLTIGPSEYKESIDIYAILERASSKLDSSPFDGAPEPDTLQTTFDVLLDRNQALTPTIRNNDVEVIARWRFLEELRRQLIEIQDAIQDLIYDTQTITNVDQTEDPIRVDRIQEIVDKFKGSTLHPHCLRLAAIRLYYESQQFINDPGQKMDLAINNVPEDNAYDLAVTIAEYLRSIFDFIRPDRPKERKLEFENTKEAKPNQKDAAFLAMQKYCIDKEVHPTMTILHLMQLRYWAQCKNRQLYPRLFDTALRYLICLRERGASSFWYLP